MRGKTRSGFVNVELSKLIQYSISVLICWMAVAPYMGNAFLKFDGLERLWLMASLSVGMVGFVALSKLHWLNRIPGLGNWLPVLCASVIFVVWELLNPSSYVGIGLFSFSILLINMLCFPVLGTALLSFYSYMKQSCHRKLYTFVLFLGVGLYLILLKLSEICFKDPYIYRNSFFTLFILYAAIVFIEKVKKSGRDNEVTEESQPCKGVSNYMSNVDLTARERDVLELLLKGKTAGPIAEQLGVGRSTVTTHMKSIYIKIGVHSQQDLIRLWESGM